MQTSPLISILMNCYNTEKFIDGAIESVLNQSYKKIELIIIDDGSKDNSKEIINNYKDHSQIKIVFQKLSLFEKHGLYSK